jgi:transposase
VFVDELKLRQLGFDGAEPAATGRPSYHPAVLLKIYIYGYLIWAPYMGASEEQAACA